MKPISDFLQQLIDEANEAIEQSQISIKEKLLYVYNQAIAENYSPKEAKKIVESKIVNVSSRYIREVLPDESKRSYTTPEIGTLPKLENLQESKESIVNISELENTFKPGDVEVEQLEVKVKTPLEIDEDELSQEQQALAPYTAVEEANTKVEEYEMRHTRDEKRIKALVDDLLKLQNEINPTEQLLREERMKTAGLLAQVEQKDRELEDHANRMQELTRRLTEATTKEVEDTDTEKNYEVAKPQYTEHWTQLLDARCMFCNKVTPWYIRHFISGKVVQLVDRERYKEMYGTVPAE